MKIRTIRRSDKSSQTPLGTAPTEARSTSARPRFLFSALIAALPVIGVAESKDEALTKFANSLPGNVQRQIARSPENFVRMVAPRLFEVSPDGVVTQDLIDLKRSQRRAGMRANRIAGILKHDTDGDGGISAQELENVLPTLPAEERGTLTLFVLKNDLDEDGGLSFEEILTAVKAREKKSTRANSSRSIPIMSFDYDQDGKVDLQEIATVIAAFDPPGMGMHTMQVTPQREPTKEACDVPAPDGAQAALVSLQQAQALSTLTIAGQDRRTSVAVVTIGEGVEPLYVFATADQPVIWKFEGATDRIQRLVVQPGMEEEPFGAAATGVDRDRITFVPPGACARRAFRSRKGQDRYDILQLQGLMGVKFEHFATARAATHLSVPWVETDMSTNPRKEKAYGSPVTFSIGEKTYVLSQDGITWLNPPAGDTNGETGASKPEDTAFSMQKLKHFYPDGLIPLDKEDVHASGPLEPYAILPSYAGLLQLMAEGSVVYDEGFFVIKRRIERFPGGMMGGYGARFVLDPGVAMPEGSPGHSSVVSGETGECLTPVIRCRG